MFLSLQTVTELSHQKVTNISSSFEVTRLNSSSGTLQSFFSSFGKLLSFPLSSESYQAFFFLLKVAKLYLSPESYQAIFFICCMTKNVFVLPRTEYFNSIGVNLERHTRTFIALCIGGLRGIRKFIIRKIFSTMALNPHQNDQGRKGPCFF